MNSTVAILAVSAVVGSGLMGGLLFAFSNFVMRALHALPSESAATAMREVNVKILNPRGSLRGRPRTSQGPWP